MMKIKLTLILLLLSAITFGQSASSILPKCDRTTCDTAGKKDIIDVIKKSFHIRKGKPRIVQDKKIYFSFFPAGNAATGSSGKALVTSTTATMYLGSRKTTNISSATFTPYFNFKGRFGLPLRSSIWFLNNTWTLQGDIRFLVYPQYTWGLGSKNSSEEKTLIDYQYIRFYQTALVRIKPYLYIGGGYRLDYRTNVHSDEPTIRLDSFTGYKYGVDGNSFSSGLSLNLLYDTRNNSVNPLPGAYANFEYRLNPKLLGSQDTWHSLYIDIRKYISLNPCQLEKQNTLAFWTYLWTSINDKTPYLDLPSTGWDPHNRSARGIDQNRYRGKTLYYFETEYRRDIIRNGLLGFVVFSNINTVSGSGTFLSSWHPAAGAGLRVKFNKGGSTNICIDYGVSKDYKGFKIGLGEAF